MAHKTKVIKSIELALPYFTKGQLERLRDNLYDYLESRDKKKDYAKLNYLGMK